MEKSKSPSASSQERLNGSETKPTSTIEVQPSVFLSSSECKEHLDKTGLNDEETKELRDALGIIIDNIFDKYFDE